MQDISFDDQARIAHAVGWALLASIVIGILAAIFLNAGIDINLSADVEATARNMLDAETRLRAQAYIGIVGFGFSTLVALGFFLLLYRTGRLLAGWSLAMAVGAAVLGLTGAVSSMNVAEIASAPAYTSITSDAQNLMLSALQVTADYTSFHLSIVMSSLANAGFFYLFLKSRQLPLVIAAWGLFASLFVAFTVVARDFFPVLGDSALTLSFMVSNLIAMVSTGCYLGIKGVRSASS